MTVTASTEERCKAAIEVFKEKLIKRGHLVAVVGHRRARRRRARSTRSTGKLVQGISSEQAKKISKLIRDEGPKGVQAQIQGDQLRVSGKKRDDLQAVIALLKGADLDVALQFTNYR